MGRARGIATAAARRPAYTSRRGELSYAAVLLCALDDGREADVLAALHEDGPGVAEVLDSIAFALADPITFERARALARSECDQAFRRAYRQTRDYTAAWLRRELKRARARERPHVALDEVSASAEWGLREIVRRSRQDPSGIPTGRRLAATPRRVATSSPAGATV